MQSSVVTPDSRRLAQVKARLLENFSRFKTTALTGITPGAFRAHIEAQLGVVDADVEGYTRDQIERQRDLSYTFHWGHNHNFGDFEMKGRMRDRHIDVMAHFMTLFPVSSSDFQNASVLDVGCWTGGTTLLLSTLSAKVHALEEVRKYANTVQFLVDSFGLRDRVSIEPKSLYSCNDPAYFDRFDIVYFPGVIYHLSDPVLALRILFNALKPGGLMLVESQGILGEEPICRFEGGTLAHDTPTAKAGSRPGWNWFVPTAVALNAMLRDAGLEDTQSVYASGFNRLFAFGRKHSQRPICRAGLSLPSIR